MPAPSPSTIDAQGTTSAGGFVLPNDRVDVIRTVKGSGTAMAESYNSETLLTNVKVLAIGQNIQEKNGAPTQVGSTATLELDPVQAETVILAQRTGQLSLALRSMQDAAQTGHVAIADGKTTVIRYGSRPMPAPISRRARHAAPIVLAALALGSTLIGHAARAQPIIDPGRNVASVPAPPFVKVAPTQAGARFTLAVGKSSIVDLPGDASEVFIGNPAVANAVVRSAHKMFVMGVANGQTTIFALDKAGNQLATLELTVGRDTSELSAIYRTALPDADIRVQTVDDTIILTGTVNSAVDAQRALDIANAFVNYTAVGGGSASAAAAALRSRSAAPRW